MNLVGLATQIQQTSQIMQQSALVAVNTNLTIRNWLIGFYIVEFEQKGEDRAKYGDKLLQNLAHKLNEDGFSYRNLNLFRQFFISYPQLSDYIRKYLQIPDYENIGILQSVIAELNDEVSAIMQTPSAQFKNSTSTIWQSPIAKSYIANIESLNGVKIPSDKLMSLSI